MFPNTSQFGSVQTGGFAQPPGNVFPNTSQSGSMQTGGFFQPPGNVFPNTSQFGSVQSAPSTSQFCSFPQASQFQVAAHDTREGKVSNTTAKFGFALGNEALPNTSQLPAKAFTQGHGNQCGQTSFPPPNAGNRPSFAAVSSSQGFTPDQDFDKATHKHDQYQPSFQAFSFQPHQ